MLDHVMTIGFSHCSTFKSVFALLRDLFQSNFAELVSWFRPLLSRFSCFSPFLAAYSSYISDPSLVERILSLCTAEMRREKIDWIILHSVALVTFKFALGRKKHSAVLPTSFPCVHYACMCSSLEEGLSAKSFREREGLFLFPVYSGERGLEDPTSWPAKGWETREGFERNGERNWPFCCCSKGQRFGKRGDRKRKAAQPRPSGRVFIGT